MSVSIRKYIYCQLNNLRSHILLSQVLPCYILYALAKHNDLAFLQLYELSQTLATRVFKHCRSYLWTQTLMVIPDPSLKPSQAASQHMVDMAKELMKMHWLSAALSFDQILLKSARSLETFSTILAYSLILPQI